MHGDFEAQRHWMELTINVSPARWYFYDLEYWGPDYPPLTMYHSWLMGIIAWLISPKWVALDTSRGFESADLKLFMRITVLASEYLVYVPAAIFCIRRLARLSHLSSWTSWAVLAAFLMQPATMLIDHGHFQYNAVMQGLVVGALANAYADRLLWCCILFVAALMYKQMALYFAVVFFAYLLGVCLGQGQYVRLFGVAVITLVAFVIMVAPLLLGSLYGHYRNPMLAASLEPSPMFASVVEKLPYTLEMKSILYALLLQVTQLLHRIFPFARGVFEDKVANFWCALNTVYKLKRLPTSLLTRATTVLTALGFLPSFTAILIVPQKRLLLPALASCAWAFFLFSFQVHEKSVLLPLLPMTLMLADDGENTGGVSREMRAWVGWANALASWTLYPLLKRDSLAVPYAVLTLLWLYLFGLPPTSFSLYGSGPDKLSPIIQIVHSTFYILALGWHLGEKAVPPPADKPDLWLLLNCVIGAAGFAVCYFWCTWQLYARSGLLDALVRRASRAWPSAGKKGFGEQMNEKMAFGKAKKKHQI